MTECEVHDRVVYGFGNVSVILNRSQSNPDVLAVTGTCATQREPSSLNARFETFDKRPPRTDREY